MEVCLDSRGVGVVVSWGRGHCESFGVCNDEWGVAKSGEWFWAWSAGSMAPAGEGVGSSSGSSRRPLTGLRADTRVAGSPAGPRAGQA